MDEFRALVLIDNLIDLLGLGVSMDKNKKRESLKWEIGITDEELDLIDSTLNPKKPIGLKPLITFISGQ